MNPHRCLAVLLFAACGFAVRAERCHLDAQPAATLLLPYFEVDLDAPDGRTTLFTVGNAAAQATVAHLTLWTDWGVPTGSFDIFLTGFDLATLNLRSFFVDGSLPITADQGGDPADLISPHGEPGWDGSVEGCAAFLPYGVNPLLSEGTRQRLQAQHTGQPWQGEDCWGADHGDRVVRGYLTIDNARACSVSDPTAQEYFSPGLGGVASPLNQLWGDFFLVDPSADLALGDTLVHLQAGATETGDATFYGSVDPTGANGREPLPDVFGVRTLSGGLFQPGTDLLVWRDVGTRRREPRACDEPPPPLHQGPFYAFDEEESVVGLCMGCPVCSPPGIDDCLPLATQRVNVGAFGTFYSPYPFGWLYLDLRFAGNGASGQAWVVPLHSAADRFSVGTSALALHGACDSEEPPTPYPF